MLNMAFLALLSFIFEFIDCSLGMGYGTGLAPILLLLGFTQAQAVPAILIGQLVGDIGGGIVHHLVGNVSLDFGQDKEIKKRLGMLGYIPKSPDSKVIYLLFLCSVVGAVIGVVSGIKINPIIIKGYIGAMVFLIGAYTIVKKPYKTSWLGITIVGIIAAFNKGLSGGGYGPLVTGGQVVSGREAKNSVGSTTFAEIGVCLVGIVTYFIMRRPIDLKLTGAMVVGAVGAAPLAALCVSKVNNKWLKIAIGILTLLLGALSLLQTFVFHWKISLSI